MPILPDALASHARPDYSDRPVGASRCTQSLAPPAVPLSPVTTSASASASAPATGGWWRGLKRWWAGQHAVTPVLTPGLPQAAATQGDWVLAWASVASPHHTNQDCTAARWLAAPTPGSGAGVALAVADGVTQGAVGHVAALALVQHWLQAAPDLPQAQRRAFLAQADEAVTQAISQHGSQPGAATGAAVWLDGQGQGWATRVGDCRVLMGQPGALESPAQPLQACLPDQTYGLLYPEWFSPGVPAPLHPEQPACMAGGGRLGEPESIALHVPPGGLLLLCSDGLHSAVPPVQLAQLLAQHLPPGPWLPQQSAALRIAAQVATDNLIHTAVAQGSEDDVTALLLLHCQPQTTPSPPGGHP